MKTKKEKLGLTISSHTNRRGIRGYVAHMTADFAQGIALFDSEHHKAMYLAVAEKVEAVKASEADADVAAPGGYSAPSQP